MTVEEVQEKEWLKGQSLERVKEVTKFFNDFDESITHGSMAGVSKPTVASWLAEGALHESALTKLACERLRSARSIRDFTDETRVIANSGSFYVKRIATSDVDDACELIKQATHFDSAQQDLFATQAPVVFFELFEEKREHVEIAKKLNLFYLCTKIRSSAELVGVYASEDIAVRTLDAADVATQAKLKLKLNVKAAAKEVSALETLFTEHYSKYNKEKAWSAIALRSYGGEVGFIAKPTAMTQSWQRKNPDKMKLELQDTELRSKLTECDKLVAKIPGVKHRVRLMKLAPGGGELERHTDNQDSDIGTAEGHLMRVHIPLITNEDVEFTSWSLRGNQILNTMKPNEAWYLDIRKPHRAVNGGATDRIHLVIDVESCAQLRALLP